MIKQAVAGEELPCKAEDCNMSVFCLQKASSLFMMSFVGLLMVKHEILYNLHYPYIYLLPMLYMPFLIRHYTIQGKSS